MGVTLKKRDEMISLITGLNFLLQVRKVACICAHWLLAVRCTFAAPDSLRLCSRVRRRRPQHVQDECYFLETPEKPLSSRKIVYPMRTHQETFPYLLVNIGSGGERRAL
jgi:hypothetical protein